MKKVITISREFGSGGRAVGIALAKKLNIPFYDKELVTLAGKSNGLSEKILSQHEESFSSLQSFAGIGVGLFANYQESISDQIHKAQCKVIQALAAKGSCIIVGRCADYVLEGRSINVFVYADLSARIARKCSIAMDEHPSDMEKHILSIDKKRKKYYEYYTDKKWGDPASYHLCFNTAPLSVDDCADIIATYVVRYAQEAE